LGKWELVEWGISTWEEVVAEEGSLISGQSLRKPSAYIVGKNTW
jgi:hypothetical protein